MKNAIFWDISVYIEIYYNVSEENTAYIFRMLTACLFSLLFSLEDEEYVSQNHCYTFIRLHEISQKMVHRGKYLVSILSQRNPVHNLLVFLINIPFTN
jgi:hypothetical protein